MLFDGLRHPAFLTGLVLQAVLVLTAIDSWVELHAEIHGLQQ